MNILIPTADYPPIEGGISTVALRLSRELAELGHSVTVVAPHFPGQTEFDKSEPVTVVRFRGYGLGWLRFFPMLAATLPLMKRADAILGINIAYGGVMGLLGRWLFAKPYVTFGYAYEFLKFRRVPPLAALLRRAYQRSKFVVAISAFTRERLVEFGVSVSRIETILPGAPEAKPISKEEIEHAKRAYNLNGHKMVLAVGRMIARKGHSTLIRALPRILEAHPDTVLICAGRGPCLSETRDLANELGVADNVRLPGYVPDDHLAALYQSCEVFALPTGEDANGQVEGFGLVFAEAQAYGKPVVAGRSGGVTDAVEDGKTGLLIPPGDTDALAQSVISLLDDPIRAAELGANGKARVARELNWPHFTRRLLEALEART